MSGPLVSTAYPAQAQTRRSQRIPYSFISGSDIDNDGGAVASNNSVNGMNSVATASPVNKDQGSKVINSDEAGSRFVSGSTVGAIAEKFKISVANKNGKAKTKFTSDISAAPASSGWDYTTKQLNSKYYVVTYGSELITNPDFTSNATGWTYTGGGTPVWSSNYGGSIHLLDGTLGQAGISVTSGVLYRLEIVIEEFAIPDSPIIAGITIGSTTASTLLNKVGTHNIDIVSPATSTAAIFMGTSSVDNESDCYIGNVSFKAITAKDINTTFGTDDELAKFKNGAATIQAKDWANI